MKYASLWQSCNAEGAAWVQEDSTINYVVKETDHASLKYIYLCSRGQVHGSLKWLFNAFSRIAGMATARQPLLQCCFA